MLLTMSISGGILILWILILRAAGKNFLPKRFFILLWDIALLRLLLPVQFPIAYGIATPIFTLLKKGRQAFFHTSTAVTTETAGSLSAKLQQQQTGLYADSLSFAKATANCYSYFTAIWFFTGAALILLFCTLYLREYRNLQTAVPLQPDAEYALRKNGILTKRIRLLESDRLSTPMTFGILFPKIIFPKQFAVTSINDDELRYILAHEKTHIQRADNLRKIIVFLALSIHWFNPLVWCMYFLVNRDMELACDETVLAKWGESYRAEYAMTLVHMAEKQQQQRQQQRALFSNGFGQHAIKERIVTIMKYKRTTAAGIGCAAILLAGAMTIFAQGTPATADTATKTTEQNTAQTVADTSEQKTSDTDAQAAATEAPKDTTQSDESSNTDDAYVFTCDDGDCVSFYPNDSYYEVNGEKRELTKAEIEKIDEDGITFIIDTKTETESPAEEENADTETESSAE